MTNGVPEPGDGRPPAAAAGKAQEHHLVPGASPVQCGLRAEHRRGGLSTLAEALLVRRAPAAAVITAPPASPISRTSTAQPRHRVLSSCATRSSTTRTRPHPPRAPPATCRAGCAAVQSGLHPPCRAGSARHLLERRYFCADPPGCSPRRVGAAGTTTAVVLTPLRRAGNRGPMDGNARGPGGMAWPLDGCSSALNYAAGGARGWRWP